MPFIALVRFSNTLMTDVKKALADVYRYRYV